MSEEQKCDNCGEVSEDDQKLSEHVDKEHPIDRENKESDNTRFITYEKIAIMGLLLVGVFIFINQILIFNISGGIETSTNPNSNIETTMDIDVTQDDIENIGSTGEALLTVFPELDEAENQDDVMNVMMPSGRPEYSDLIGGANFDEMEMSNQYLSQWYYEISEDVRQNHPETWDRFVDLTAAPNGISCEFCCGLGAQAVDEDGEMMCACAHLPSMLSVTLALMRDTDYSDAEILREVMKWKTAFFPQDMINLGSEIAGEDIEDLDMPGMVGGC